MGRREVRGDVLGGKKDVCGLGPRGARRAQFLLRSPVAEAQRVPKGGGQGEGWQELCEPVRLRGGGRWTPPGMQGGEGQRALEGWCVEQPGFLKSRSWGSSEGQPGSCNEDQGACCPLSFSHETSWVGGSQPLGGSLRRE